MTALYSLTCGGARDSSITDLRRGETEPVIGPRGTEGEGARGIGDEELGYAPARGSGQWGVRRARLFRLGA